MESRKVSAEIEKCVILQAKQGMGATDSPGEVFVAYCSNMANPRAARSVAAVYDKRTIQTTCGLQVPLLYVMFYLCQASVDGTGPGGGRKDIL